MVARPYRWEDGAPLEAHTRRKHKILREASRQFIMLRAALPQQTKLRLAIVDGFAGAGAYLCGSPGSPVILIEEVRRALATINIDRVGQGLPMLDIECLLIFNDADPGAIELLRTRCAPLLAEIKESDRRLHLEPHYLVGAFEQSYPAIKRMIERGSYHNVLFNLDQCGYSKVEIATLSDIMACARSAEIFFTFSIKPLLAFLQRKDELQLARQLSHVGVTRADIDNIDALMSHQGWLGAAERLVFEQFAACARFVSPFSIHNPGGWRYWLIHFANQWRARQVYNDILHANASSQAHFGRSGLNMLSYNPREEGGLFLFDVSGRDTSRAELATDIPRLITETGDALSVRDFYETIYNATAAHSDDIASALLACDDLEVQMEGGGVRGPESAIDLSDAIRLKRRRNVFPMFLGPARRGDEAGDED